MGKVTIILVVLLAIPTFVFLIMPNGFVETIENGIVGEPQMDAVKDLSNDIVGIKNNNVIEAAVIDENNVINSNMIKYVVTDNISTEIPINNIQAPDVSVPKEIKPTLNIPNIELLIHQEINQQRQIHGMVLLDYDDQISMIAKTHSNDMAKNNYFEHTSLDGKESHDRGMPYGYETCGTFEAITLQTEYDNLSREYDNLSREYDNLFREYDKYPQVIENDSEYQKATLIYNKLNKMTDRINNIVDRLNNMAHRLNFLSDNNKLFGGLAENIFQTWTYDSTTYIDGVPIYDFNTDEDIAEQSVTGWMNSPGHRANILSGFHSEGIGIVIASDDKIYVTQNFC